MVISNLNYLESTSEDTMVEGAKWRGWYGYHRGRPGFDGVNVDVAVNVANITQLQFGGRNNTQFAAIGQNADA